MNVVRRACFSLTRRSSAYYSTYKSSLSLSNLYPSSNLNITTPEYKKDKSEDSSGKFTGYIPRDKLHITYSHSSGPGGQNVNVLNTKVDVRFHVQSAEWLSKDIRNKLLSEHKTKINKEGFFIIRSEKTRSQQLNVVDALHTLRSLLWKLSEPPSTPSPESLEKLRKQREKSARMRLVEKRNRSETKKNRQAPETNF